MSVNLTRSPQLVRKRQFISNRKSCSKSSASGDGNFLGKEIPFKRIQQTVERISFLVFMHEDPTQTIFEHLCKIRPFVSRGVHNFHRIWTFLPTQPHFSSSTSSFIFYVQRLIQIIHSENQFSLFVQPASKQCERFECVLHANIPMA